jgi:hypothetical protein
MARTPREREGLPALVRQLYSCGLGQPFASEIRRGERQPSFEVGAAVVDAGCFPSRPASLLSVPS